MDETLGSGLLRAKLRCRKAGYYLPNRVRYVLLVDRPLTWNMWLRHGPK